MNVKSTANCRICASVLLWN